MKTVGLVLKPGVEQALSLAADLIAWAREREIKVFVDPNSEKLLQAVSLSSQVHALWLEELPSRCDVVVSMGGDGTLIGVARHAGGADAVMLGVNFGTLGFLTEIKPNELFDLLNNVRNGTAIVGSRMLLKVDQIRGEEKKLSTCAINDVVIHKGTRDRLLELDILVDGAALTRVRSDGVVIATPTGSTAYSLAAGGSIAHPELPVILLTPICPHSLTIRPIILSANSQIEIQFPPYDGEILATVDGQVSQLVSSGDKLTVTCAPFSVQFVKSLNRSYFDILTAKLNWGIPNRAN